VPLADLVEAGEVFMVEEVREARFALDVAALAGEVFQAGVKQRFGRGEEGEGRESWSRHRGLHDEPFMEII